MLTAKDLASFRDLDQRLARLPGVTAQEVQDTAFRQALEAKRAIATRSTMSDSGKRAIRTKNGIVRISPSRRPKVNRLRDVRLELFSAWKGAQAHGRASAPDAAARSIEKEVGQRGYRPKRARALLIPAGDFRTASGGVKRRRTGAIVGQTAGGKARRGLEAVDIAKLPNTRVVTIRRRSFIVQDIRGKTGGARRKRRRADGSSSRGRVRVVGILVPRAKITARLDFFGSWASLASTRTGQYGRAIEKALGRIAR